MKAVKAAELGEQIVLTVTVTKEELAAARKSPQEFIGTLCEACGIIPDSIPEEPQQEDSFGPELQEQETVSASETPEQEENTPFVIKGYKGMPLPVGADSMEEIADLLIDRLIADNKIPVSMEEVEAETEYTFLGIMQKMRYDKLFGGAPALSEEEPDPEALRAEIKEDLIREQKEKAILQSIIDQEGIGASPEELLQEAEAMAERQSTTLEMIKGFFGEDLQGMAQEVKMRKAKDFLIENAKPV